MQDRRGFFQSIAGLFAVAAVNPVKALDLDLDESSFYSSRPDTNLPMIPESVRSQLTRLTEFIHQRISKEIIWPTEIVQAHKIGEMGLPHQFGIDLYIDPKETETLSDPQIEGRYVLPIVNRFVDEFQDMKASRFGVLHLPGGLEHAVLVRDDKFAIRGLQAFDFGHSYEDMHGEIHVTEPHWVARFEVLFG